MGVPQCGRLPLGCAQGGEPGRRRGHNGRCLQAGAYWGEAGIPLEWLEGLAEREMIEKALEGLL